MSKIDNELYDLITKFEEQNKNEFVIWENQGKYTLVRKVGFNYYPIKTLKKMAALKSLRTMVK